MKQPLVSVIRFQLRAQGLTQAALAQKLRVSLPTAKRWLRGDGLDLDGLDRLLEVVGLSLSEAAALAGEVPHRTFKYTGRQETFLAGNVLALAVLDELLQGATPSQAARTLGLGAAALQRVLRGLEGVDLLERHPGGRSKLLVRGEPVWKKDGPLALKFRRHATQALLAQAERFEDAKKLGIYRLLPEDVTRARVLLDDLRLHLRRSEARARARPAQARTHGCLTALAPFDWSFLRTPAQNPG